MSTHLHIGILIFVAYLLWNIWLGRLAELVVVVSRSIDEMPKQQDDIDIGLLGVGRTPPRLGGLVFRALGSSKGFI